MNVLTLKQLLDKSSEKYSESVALSFVDSEEITYKIFYKSVKSLSAYLDKMNLKKGDRIAILSESSPNWGVAYFAITISGYIAVPILPDFLPESIEGILDHSEAKGIFISERLKTKLEDIKISKDFFNIKIDDFSIINKKKKIEYIDLTTSKEYTETQINEEDTAVIIYTSGTTGTPKGVVLSHKNLVSNVISSSHVETIVPGDRFLSVLPMSHTYECTIGFLLPIYCGASVYYLKGTPSPSVLLPALAKVKPTKMLTVPLLIEKIYKLRILPELRKKKLVFLLYKTAPFRKLFNFLAGKKLMKTFGGELSFFGIGGASLDPVVERFLREGKFPYAIGYGLTECSPLIAGANAKNTRYRSTGPAIQNVQVKISAKKNKAGEGEILVKGPSVMKGYYKDEEKTKEVFDSEGWFKTGDLGFINKKGNLYIRGRLKNMILGPSGENIYPEEIEAVINQFKYVLESIVFKNGKKLVALIHFNYDEIMSNFDKLKINAQDAQKQMNKMITDLKKSVNEKLNSFSKISEILENKEPFEKTPSMKIKRFLYINKKLH